MQDMKNIDIARQLVVATELTYDKKTGPRPQLYAARPWALQHRPIEKWDECESVVPHETKLLIVVAGQLAVVADEQLEADRRRLQERAELGTEGDLRARADAICNRYGDQVLYFARRLDDRKMLDEAAVLKAMFPKDWEANEVQVRLDRMK